MKKFFFVHTLNNYSGSPNILSVLIKELITRGYEVDLLTSKTKGFLSDIEGVKYHYTFYRWNNNKVIGFLLFFISQIHSFIFILFSFRSNVIYYINTITPVGAVIACFMSKKKYFYHVHEDMNLQKSVYCLYRMVYKSFNKKSIFVSNYVMQCSLNVRDGIVVQNCLSEKYANEVEAYVKSNLKSTKETVLMVSSLKKYKGVFEFVEIAKILPDFRFELVLSANKGEINDFFKKTNIPPNLFLYERQVNLHSFYQRARILLQLSQTDKCIETFGLTILEAMTYGVPCIVPDKGGPLELIENNVSGFIQNSTDVEGIANNIRLLMNNEEMCNSFSIACTNKAMMYNVHKMTDEIIKYCL